MRTAIESIDSSFPGSILEVTEFRGETTILVDKNGIEGICAHLKKNLGFKFIVDITAVDYLGIKSPRFQVVYLLHRFGENYEENARIRLKVALSEDDLTIRSVTSVWKGADWLEREVYDMFGIVFEGHPDLRRILMPEDYDHFPLRKDFDVRNREPSKRCFENALKEVGTDFKGSFHKR